MVILVLFGIGGPIAFVIYVIYVAFYKKRAAFAALPDDDQAVILRIHGASVEDKFKTRIELQNFVDRLQWAMGNIGEVRDVSMADGAAAITIMGESAEEMYTKVRRVLRHFPIEKRLSGPSLWASRKSGTAHAYGKLMIA